MRKITLEEHNSFPGRVLGVKSEFMLAAEALEPNEGIFIARDEWKMKSPPSNRIISEFRRIKSPKKFICKTMPDGWSILRTE